ncbi:MAG: RDD family protein [Saprospiraceae bacterium]|nr:RDD family protein [Saprospiraceae bacterium]
MNKTIEITTTQNVTIEYELAPLRERMLAWLLDLLIVIFGYILLFQLLGRVFGRLDDEAIALFLLPLLIYFLYNIFFEIWNSGQTPGKMATNIKVVRLDGKDPEWSDVMLRALLQLVDTLFSAGVVGVLLIKTTGKSQRFGDMAANTSVIRLFGSQFNYRLEDILSISSLDNYQPVYPQVRRLSERDMIFIKNLLVRLQRYPNSAHAEAMEDLVTHLMPLLDIEQRPLDRPNFLKTLLRDYVVLTR